MRDVFYVSSAAMLVRTDLFEALGGFDPDTFPGSEDLDLCWRAWLAGARVVVAPDARAAHVEGRDVAAAPRTSRAHATLARRRVRVVLTSYSRRSLLRVVPLADRAGRARGRRRSRRRPAVARRWRCSARGGGTSCTPVDAGWLAAARKRRAPSPTASFASCRSARPPRVGAFLSQHHADERIESLEDRVRDNLESVLHA